MKAVLFDMVRGWWMLLALQTFAVPWPAHPHFAPHTVTPPPPCTPHPRPPHKQDGVLCNSEGISRKAGAKVMAELYGLTVDPDEFIPFTGTGEANFLGAWVLEARPLRAAGGCACVAACLLVATRGGAGGGGGGASQP